MRVGGFPDHRTTLKDKRILVVEDESLVAMLVEEGLLDAGAKVVGPAASVEEALRLIEWVALDGGLNAAVLDLDLNGKAVSPVADRLASLGVPFLFATGYGEGCDTGGHAVPILHKPYAPDLLITTLEALASAGPDAGARPGRAPDGGVAGPDPSPLPRSAPASGRAERA